MKAIAQIVVAVAPFLLAAVPAFVRVLRGGRVGRAFAACWASLVGWMFFFCFIFPFLVPAIDRDFGREVFRSWVPEGPAVMFMLAFGWFYAGITVVLAWAILWLRGKGGTLLTKGKLLFAGVTAFLVCVVWSYSKPTTPAELEFRAFFKELSVGVPEYQALQDFSQPVDTLKGDFCTADFRQSEKQFREFVAHLGVSQESILSSTGLWIKVGSKIDPKYPWMLNVRANVSNADTNSWEIHLEGRQPYD